MPAFTVVSDVDHAYSFVSEFFSVDRGARMKGLCLRRDDETIAATLYHDFSGTNVWMHVAGKPGRRWMNRHFLHEAFKFPFVDCGLRRITGWVEVDNMDARRLNEHLGFTVEATLEAAGSRGQDVLLYRMRREECRYA